MIKIENLLQIGRLTKPHGVKGEISLLTDCDMAAVFESAPDCYLVCYMDGILIPFFLTSCRPKSGAAFLVKFDNIDDDGKVRQLAGKDAYLPSDKLPADGNVAASYPIGYTVVDRTHGEIGIVCGVDDSTANVLLQVSVEGGEMLIPAAFVTTADHAGKTLDIMLPEGFLEI